MRDGIVQRLLAEPVAVDEQTAPAVVPQRDGEHAVQPVDEVGPVLLVRVDDDLRVRRRPEPVALALELRAQVRVVVDLAVVDGPDRAVLVGNRLASVAESDDAEAPVPEPHGPVHVEPVVVRPPVRDRGVQTVQQRLVDARAGVEGISR